MVATDRRPHTVAAFAPVEQAADAVVGLKHFCVFTRIASRTPASCGRLPPPRARRYRPLPTHAVDPHGHGTFIRAHRAKWASHKEKVGKLATRIEGLAVQARRRALIIYLFHARPAVDATRCN